MARFEIKTDFGTFEVNADNEQLAMQAALMQGGQQMRDRAMNLFSSTQPQASDAIREMAGRAAPKTDIGGGEATGRSYLDTLVTNLGQVPDLVASIASNAPAMRNAANATGMQLPKIGDRGIVPGVPTTEDVMGAAQMTGEAAAAISTGDFQHFTPFKDAKNQQAERNLQAREQNPAFSVLGDILGDASTLAILRKPVSKSRTLQHVSARPVDMAFGTEANKMILMNPGTRREVHRYFGGDAAKTFYNRAGRVAETGLEGAILTYLSQEEDPLRIGAYAAGGQAAGSIVLGAMGSITKDGVFSMGTAGRLATAAVVSGAMYQYLKGITPGGNNFILPSIESGFDKVSVGIALGTLAGIAGAGRFSGGTAESFPVLADQITAALRGANINMFNKIYDNEVNGDGSYRAVMNKVETNPDYFGEAAATRLSRAYLNGKLPQEIDSLMKNRTFRSRFEAMD